MASLRDLAITISWLTGHTSISVALHYHARQPSRPRPAEQQCSEELVRRSRGAISFIGMWHSHPDSAAEPSQQDMLTMHELINSAQAKSSAPLLLLILGPGTARFLDDCACPGLYVRLFSPFSR
jgi:integrative and conjugative element protein (TIGR02256 family)